MNADSFDQIQSIASERGKGPAISFLVEQYRTQSQYPELFEALKMQIRHELGLPLQNQEKPDELSASVQARFEDRLLEACQEVGTALFRQGNLEEGWMYLQPIGDRQLLKNLLLEVEPTEQNIDLLIDIALGQSIAPALGYELILKHHGTCNSITIFDTQIIAQPKYIRAELAALLVDQIYSDLKAALVRHLAESDVKTSDSDSVLELIMGRDALFENGGHHLDATHLASVVRIGRVCDQPQSLQQLLELCEYGSRLAPDFHFAGQAPFENTYHDHLMFYRGLLDISPDQSVEYFQAKALEVPIEQIGTVPIETYVDYLVRLGRRMQAIQISCEHLSDAEGLQGIAPRIFDIAKSDSENSYLMNHLRSQDDFLGFSMCVLNNNDSGDETQ